MTFATGDMPEDNEYAEYKDSGQERYVPENAEALRVFITTWDDRYLFIKNLLGYSYFDEDTLRRVTPEPHPNLDFLFAIEATVTGLGEPLKDEDDFIHWDFARIDVKYRYLPYNVIPDDETTTELQRYCTREFLPQAEYLTVPTRNFIWYTTEDGTHHANLKAPPGFISCSMMKEITWHQIPERPAIDGDNPPNFSEMTRLQGTINSTLFDGHYPGTALFTGFTAKRRSPTIAKDDEDTNFITWDLTLRFLIRENGDGIGGTNGGFDDTIAGHEYLFHPSAAGGAKWDLVTVDGTATGQRIYLQSDHNSLFTFGATDTP